MSSEMGLYGIRKPKTTLKEISSSTSLAFTSTLSDLLSLPPSSSQPGRQRPSKRKDDIFAAHNKGAKERAARDLKAGEIGGQVHKRSIEGVDDTVLKRSRRKMEEKARRYRELKEGGDDGGEALVDFDRMWAERQADGKTGEESESDEEGDGDETVEYEDEYGRARQGTRADAARMERRIRNQEFGVAELDRMSARPVMPTKLIYGDTVQTAAFDPDAEVKEKMEALAKRRDRSMTPPEMKHYEADKEFRIKGVGFYSFSKDEAIRGQEMEALEKERVETERVRDEGRRRKEDRKKEIEERRRVVREKRAKKQAESFLDGLGADLEDGKS